MTERFSPEYIDFVTKCEPIQALWRKRGVWVGDWIWRAVVYEDVRMIVKIEKPNIQDIAAYLDNGRRLYRRHLKKPELIAWLPTLSDLLDLIIQANKECDERADLTELAYVYDDNSWGVADWCDGVVIRDGGWNDDSELAAARLLERVLAGKEDQNGS